jgi:predicted MFS family arabinose efflux permease
MEPLDTAWRRLALGGGAGMFVVMALGRFSYTAMVPVLVSAGGLSPVEAGRVGTVNLVGFFIGAAGSIALARWLGRRALLQLMLLLAVAGLLASGLATGFLDLAVLRGIIGIATGVVMVHSLALIAETAPADRRAEAQSYVFAGVGLGILSSGVLVPVLLAWGLAATWLALGLTGVAVALIAGWGWRGAAAVAVPPSRARDGSPAGRARSFGPGMAGLLVAHFLFSFGIVPHSLYWVDFIVRAQGLGFAAGGLHWSLVGVFAVLGPIACAALARRLGTRVALVAAFVVLGAGILAPALLAVAPVLVASSVIFGAQPGLSSLMAARARDLGRAEAMGRVMRAMILANASGALIGGIAVPWIYAATASQALLFMIGGLAMLAAAAAAWPRRGEAGASGEG